MKKARKKIEFLCFGFHGATRAGAIHVGTAGMAMAVPLFA